MTNSEKFKTVTERERGFLLFCNKHNDDGLCVKCPLNNKATKRLGCAYAWLDLEFEEEKPLPCPFCGSFIVVEEHERFRMYNATCNNYTCRYQAPMCNSEAEAIAVHNSVCKAIAAQNESEVK